MNKLLGGLIGLNCVYVAVVFGWSQASDLFPLPFLYLLEIALLGVGATWISWSGRRSAWLWPMSGILVSFVVLGGLSIGPYLIPAALMSLVLALLMPHKTFTPLQGFGLLIAAAIAQTLVMLAILTIH
jgi:hypothetical protein